MTTSFLTCTNCGQRSSDTKRCKHCGQVFGRAPEAMHESTSKRGWRPIVVIGVVVIIAAGVWQWKQTPRVAPTVADTTTISAPADTTTVTIPAAPIDTPRAVAPAPVELPKATVPQETVATKPVAPAPAPARVAFDAEHQRYAQTWANVRAERNSTAPVLQVLDRGEVVAVDSLEGGWYRVTTDRPTVGYVDQQYLDTLPPSAP